MGAKRLLQPTASAEWAVCRRRLAARAEQLTFASDDVCRGLCDHLQHNLGEIPDLASAALGLGHSDHPIAEGLPLWRLQAKLEPPVSTDVGWLTRLPWWLKPLPTGLVKSWLTKRQEREHTRLIESYKGPLLAAVESRFNAALDELWDEVSKRAGEIEWRVQVTLEGKQSAESGETALDSIRAKLLALREEILGLPIATIRASTQPPVLIEPIASPPTIEPSIVPPAEAAIAKNLGTRGCPVCDHLHQVAFGFFSHCQYALSSDEKVQTQFAVEGGFCALHAWQLEAISSSVGLSVGYPQLVERISRVLAQAAQSSDAE
jgi:hypothetical protein